MDVIIRNPKIFDIVDNILDKMPRMVGLFIFLLIIFKMNVSSYNNWANVLQYVWSCGVLEESASCVVAL